MIVHNTEIQGVLILEPKTFGDHRGYFLESFNQQNFQDLTGVETNFVQDNHSYSQYGVIRGLHYQSPNPQGKLVRVVTGKVLDVAVDIRKDSPTFGKSVCVELSAENHRQLWVPPGLAHGFQVLSEQGANFLYKTTDYWYPKSEHCIRYDDPDLNISWDFTITPIVSDKDKNGKFFANIEL